MHDQLTFEKTALEELEFGFDGNDVFEDPETIALVTWPDFPTDPGAPTNLGDVGDQKIAARKLGGGVEGTTYGPYSALIETVGGTTTRKYQASFNLEIIPPRSG